MNLKQTLKRTEYYQIITGTISELEVFDTEAQFFTSRKLADLPAAGLLALGHAAATASQLNTADDNAEGIAYLNSVQYFRCKIGSNIIEGTFCRVFFNNGDQVEVVVEPRDDGSYFAYALRRPIDHRLWLHPESMQGSKSGHKEAFRYSLYFFSFLFIFYIILIFFIILKKYSVSTLLFSSITSGIIIIILSTFFYFYWKSGINRGSKVADKIFATLGYPNPKEVDMAQELMEFYFNSKHESDPDFYVDITTRQYKQDADGVKWVTFYREAPPIPDYITVIDGDKVNNTNHE